MLSLSTPVPILLVVPTPTPLTVGWIGRPGPPLPGVEAEGSGTRLETARPLLGGLYWRERVLREPWDGGGPLYVRTSTGCEYVLLWAPGASGV